jgi:hypothetical protein
MLLEGCAATAGWRELAVSEESEYQVMSLELARSTSLLILSVCTSDCDKRQLIVFIFVVIKGGCIVRIIDEE